MNADPLSFGDTRSEGIELSDLSINDRARIGDGHCLTIYSIFHGELSHPLRDLSHLKHAGRMSDNVLLFTGSVFCARSDETTCFPE
jgi:hypothetical protein